MTAAKTRLKFLHAREPGLRLKVLASGLHQLANKCEKIAGELAADAQPPSIATSGWQSSTTHPRNDFQYR
jgi:hypothetical protein